MQTINRKLFHRATLLLTLIITLTIATARLRADTGTCSFAMVTIPFTDVPSSNTFFCAIAEAYFSGLTNGTSATTYNPSGTVPREQMAAFVTRTLDQSLKRGSRRAELGMWWRDDTRLYGVGALPIGIKSDGKDLWVANSNDGTIQRLRSSDGRILETWNSADGASEVVIARGYVFTTAVGPLSDPGLFRIYRIDPSLPSGSVTTITNLLPNIPRDITCDGRRLWVAMLGAVSIVSIDGVILDTLTTGFSSPLGIIFDGTYIWVTDADATIKKLDLNGNILQSVTVGGSPSRPVFDGTNIWVPNTSTNTVTVVRASTGAVIATLSGNNLAGPVEAAFDGERILITNAIGGGANTVPSMWKATDLSPIDIVDTTTGTQYSVCSDGVNFWMTKPSQNQVWRY